MPWLRQAAEAYFNETLALGKRLLRVFAVSVDMPEDFFLQFTTKPMVQSRLFHYPPQPVPDDKQLGVAPHTDYGMITLLTQDPIGGLEPCRPSRGWGRAPWIDNTLVLQHCALGKVWSHA